VAALAATSIDHEGAPRTEAELVALVEAVRAAPSRRGELISALREGSALHAQKGRIAVRRMRGWVLAAFEAVGLPDEAIPFVVEELESGIDPYLLAAAARAVPSCAAGARARLTHRASAR